MPEPVTQLRWEERNVSVGRTRLHLRWVVQPTAPPVLLLHGLGADGSVWQPFARRLLPHWAALAPDLPGHGQSGPPSRGSYQAADYAADLAAWLAAEAIGPLPVVGHSLGALVALLLAADDPGTTSRLVLVDPPVDAAESRAGIESVSRLRGAAPGLLEDEVLRQYPAGGALAAEHLARLFRATTDGAFEAMLRAPSGHPEAWTAARRVQVPALVVQADPGAGGIISDDAAREFTAALPVGQLLKIDGSSHAIHASKPVDLARALLAFLD